VRRKNILIYIQQDATLHSLVYLETALLVSGGATTHHQERKQLYIQRCDKYQMLKIQLFALLMMGGHTTQNM
jgi:hypothetical protein